MTMKCAGVDMRDRDGDGSDLRHGLTALGVEFLCCLHFLRALLLTHAATHSTPARIHTATGQHQWPEAIITCHTNARTQAAARAISSREDRERDVHVFGYIHSCSR